MSNSIHILNASGSLTSIESEIKRIVKIALAKAKRYLKFRGVDILVRSTESPSLKALGGVGGYCPEPYYVDITIDKRYVKSKKHFAEALERTLLHELHHAARQQLGFSFVNITVYQQIIAEGSADFFVYQVTGKVPVWARAKKNQQRLMKILRTLFKKRLTDKLYAQLFLVGDAKRKIPKWAGYALGFALVQAEQEKHNLRHPGEKARKAVKEE